MASSGNSVSMMSDIALGVPNTDQDSQNRLAAGSAPLSVSDHAEGSSKTPIVSVAAHAASPVQPPLLMSASSDFCSSSSSSLISSYDHSSSVRYLPSSKLNTDLHRQSQSQSNKVPLLPNAGNGNGNFQNRSNETLQTGPVPVHADHSRPRRYPNTVPDLQQHHQIHHNPTFVKYPEPEQSRRLTSKSHPPLANQHPFRLNKMDKPVSSKVNPFEQSTSSSYTNDSICGSDEHNTGHPYGTEHGKGGNSLKHSKSFYSVTLPKIKYLKVPILSALIIYTLISFIFIREKEETWTNIAVQKDAPAFVDLSHSLDLMFPVWKLRTNGPFLPNEYESLTDYSVVFTIVQLLDNEKGGDRHGGYRVVKSPWAAPVAPRNLSLYLSRKEVEHVFKLSRDDAYDHVHRYQLRIDTNSEESIGLTVNMAGFSELSADGIILASSVLIFLYTMIIFEVVNRTLAAMLGATAAITCLTLIRDRPSLEKVVSWLDVETLCLLFGMMILVAILCETGFFDYIAVIAFRMAKGRIWPLIFTLCFFTGVLSAFLDNVTTILLMTPITIRLCEIKNIDPKHVLISLVMFSNIGGAATPVGDPPNVIIISSSKIQQQGIDFGRFTLHMMPGILLSFIATLFFIRFYYRDLSKGEFIEGTGSQANSNDLESGSNEQIKVIFKKKNRVLDSECDPSTTSITLQQHRSIPDGGDNLVMGGYGSIGSSDPVLPGPTISGLNANLDQLMSSGCSDDVGLNNLKEFCGATSSAKDSIFDERRVFRSSDELKREIEVWKRASNSISGYSRDENSVRVVLNRKVELLETILRQHCYETVPPEDNYREVLAELESKYKIRDRPLLIKSGVVMSLVISLFFMQSIPNLDLSLGWIAILGAILLLVLSDRRELESIIARVEWSTLIFFAALFVVMEALAELKFLWWIGRITQDFINSVPEQHRLIVAILVFLWISALASSFIDNIPLTTVMVKILEDLSENNEFKIPLTPLIYALAFGACLGGNGTLIGASSNVVCAGVAEQHGYRFTFMDFFRVGFPIMLLTVGISTFYLILCHVVLEWDN